MRSFGRTCRPRAGRARTRGARADVAAEEAVRGRARARTHRASGPPARAYREAQASVLLRVRVLAGAYEDMSRLFPTSGYGDNALWQGAAWPPMRSGSSAMRIDRTTALRLFTALTFPLPFQLADAEGRLADQAARRTRSRRRHRPSTRAAAADPRANARADGPGGITRRPDQHHPRSAARGPAHRDPAREGSALLRRADRWPASRLPRSPEHAADRTAQGRGHPVPGRRRQAGARRAAAELAHARRARPQRRRALQRLHALRPLPHRRGLRAQERDRAGQQLENRTGQRGCDRTDERSRNRTDNEAKIAPTTVSTIAPTSAVPIAPTSVSTVAATTEAAIAPPPPAAAFRERERRLLAVAPTRSRRRAHRHRPRPWRTRSRRQSPRNRGSRSRPRRRAPAGGAA